MIPQVPNDKGEQLRILITYKNKFNKVSEHPAAPECFMVPHWNLSLHGNQHRVVGKGMLCVFLVHFADITQVISDDFLLD